MSNNIIRFLPNLTFNNSFIEEFVLGNDTSCSTLGTVEEMKKEIGFVAIRPEKPIPEDILSKGFNLGQQMRGNDKFQLIHLIFSFYGYKNFDILLNPNNNIVRHVMNLMRETMEYFFFVFDGPSMTAFLGSIDPKDNWFDSYNNLDMINKAATSIDEYEESFAVMNNKGLFTPCLR